MQMCSETKSIIQLSRQLGILGIKPQAADGFFDPPLVKGNV